MGKKRKGNKLDALLREEYDRRTQEIEDSLSKDGSFDPERIDGDALYQRIMERIQEEEGKREEIKLKKKERRKVNIRQVGKWAAVFFVAMIGIFLASMTGEANRTYFKHTVQYMMGDEVVLKMGNNEEGEEESAEMRKEEVLARQEIKEKVGISVPIFKYEPEGRVGFQYNIELGNAAAVIEYQYKNAIINLRMINSKRTEVYGLVVHGKIIKEIEMLEGAVTTPVTKIKDSGDKEPTYAAQWEYEDGYYQLSGKLEEQEFLKVMEYIFY